MWWDRSQGTGTSYYQQKAELPALKAACPAYTEINAQVVQDVPGPGRRKPRGGVGTRGGQRKTGPPD